MDIKVKELVMDNVMAVCVVFIKEISLSMIFTHDYSH